MALVEIPVGAPLDSDWPGWTISDYLADDDLNAYPWLEDRDAERWAAVPWTWNGQQILVPFAADMRPCTRASVVATYGPLTEELHCTNCGSIMVRADGTCTITRHH